LLVEMRLKNNETNIMNGIRNTMNGHRLLRQSTGVGLTNSKQMLVEKLVSISFQKAKTNHRY
jgi:hypothetical protein